MNALRDPVRPESQPRVRSLRPTLLVVDDQPANIQVLYRALNHSYEILMATNGRQALALCAKRLPDLVLLDVLMPEMDGYAVCRLLKADPATRDVPVIFVTAYDDPAEEARGLELGAIDYISKPISPAVVTARVRGHLALAESRAMLTASLAATHQLNNELEHRVLERTAELEHARQVADAANEAKSQLLSNMSHEMRTPMNSVLGMAYLAMKALCAAPAPDAQLVGYLTHIHEAGQHLLGLIDDILDVSKFEAGKLALEIGDLDVATVLNQVERQFVYAAEKKGLRISSEVDPLLARKVRGDALRVGQVLLNFVGNAIKFSETGEVRIRAAVQAHDASGAELTIEVTDAGIGIAAGEIPKLFQAFHQGDASSTRNHGGTGLGLAICRQLATLMDGTVGVRSEPGVGSTFWLRVRLAWSEPTESLLAVHEQDAANSGEPDLRGVTVLVVDDNVINRLVATGLLDAVGATVIEARDGAEALEMMGRQRIDAVLMDVQMPVMDGLEATRRLRANSAFAGTPIIAMTANASSDDARRCRDAGMDAFMTKPVEPALLYRTLAHWLAPRERASDAATSPSGLLTTNETTTPFTPENARPIRFDMACDAALIDLAVPMRTLCGNEAKVRKYALLFRTSMTNAVAEMLAAARAEERNQLATLAHRAKSPARTVGAGAFADVCQAIESLAPTAEASELRALVSSLDWLLSRIADVIDHALFDGSPDDASTRDRDPGDEPGVA